jgi:hypothetical protein
MKTIARRIGIPCFVLAFAVAAAIDTFPETWGMKIPIRSDVNRALSWLGLQQGDWSLFAPNPIIHEGMVVGEILDASGNTAIWTSTEWAKASIWEKFYRFRHLNYSQRVVRNPGASKDLADYLKRSIPDREKAIPTIRWSEDDEPLMSDSIHPPIRQIVLHHHLKRMIREPDEPRPSHADILWGKNIEFLVRRDYEP